MGGGSRRRSGCGEFRIHHPDDVRALAAQPFTSRIFGDESLSRRPMARVMKPLAEMGAKIEARDGQFPPLTIHGGRLHAIDYTLPCRARR